MNRFFTHGELATEYRLPQHVQEQLLAEIAPVEKDDRGELLFLEAQVDAWLTARYAVTPWRAPTAAVGPRTSHPAAKKADEQETFVTVAEAQRRFLDGKMSRKWWYRLAQTGQIAYHRVGDTILFRTGDIEKFIAESRRVEHIHEVEAEPGAAQPIPPAGMRPSKKTGEGGFYRIFPKT